MKPNLTLTLLVAAALAGCAAQTAETAAAAATICAMHKDAATVAAVDSASGLSAKEAAEKKLALDIYCAVQAAAPAK